MVWTAVEFNLAKNLTGKFTPKLVKLPADISVDINIDLDKAAYDILVKDKTWLDLMQTNAKEKADKAVDEVVGQLKLGEKNAGLTSDPKAGEIIGKNLTEHFQGSLKIAGAEMVTEVNKLFENYKKGKSNLKKFQIKSSCKIGVCTIAIIGTTAVTVASHGALTPFAGVAVARSTIVIGQECVKLASTCYTTAKYVTVELAAVKKLIGENSKARGTAVETALGVLAGLSGMETPSVKNCDAHIKLHKINISKLDQKSKELSTGIDDAMDKAKDWEKRVEAAEKTLPPPKLAKAKAGLATAEKALDKLLNATIKVNESVQTAWKMQKSFEDTITGLKENVAAWTKYVDVATGMVVDIAIGVGDASKAIESALSTVIAVAADVDNALAG